MMEKQNESSGVILVVDDDTGLLRLIQKTLKRSGMESRVLPAGQDVLSQVEENRCDLMLLDYSLPDMTAKELLNALHDRECRIPFVVMTGHGDERIAVEMMKMGAQDYLVKDQNFIELLPQVMRHNLNQVATVRKLAKAEAVLASTEALYQTLIETVPHVIMMADPEGKMVFLNKAWYNLTGRTPEASLGDRWIEALHAEDVSVVLSKQDQAFRNGETYKGECRLQANDGSYRTVEFISTPVREQNGDISNWVGISTDVTERKRAVVELSRLYEEQKESQAQLIQLEKMNALGTLVAGVAHELNNPLMGILNFLQYCLKHTSKDDRRYQVLLDAESESGRCIDIVKNLLSFSRMEDDEGYELANCSVVLERVFRLLNYRIEKEGVFLTKRFDEGISEGISEVSMKVNSIQQVFFNLMTNALDAIQDSERPIVEVTVRCEDNEHVVIAITDSGCGILQDQLDKIFEPFFTTKPVGQGTGLGLSVCHGIIAAHGGRINCESKIGKGTKFEIFLPIKQEPLTVIEQ